jgi:hypothetical protein
MSRVTNWLVSKLVAVPEPVVPASPFGVTDVAPILGNSPAVKPSKLIARFSRFMNGCVIVTGSAGATTGKGAIATDNSERDQNSWRAVSHETLQQKTPDLAPRRCGRFQAFPLEKDPSFAGRAR